MLSEDGNRVISCSYDKIVRVWDVQHSKKHTLFEESHLLFFKVNISQDRKTITAETSNGTAFFYNAETGCKMNVDFEYKSNIDNMHICADGARVAIVCNNQSVIKVFEAGNRMIKQRTYDGEKVGLLDISSDGKIIVFVCNQIDILVWDLEHDNVQRVEIKRSKQRGMINSVRISADGQRIFWSNQNFVFAKILNEDDSLKSIRYVGPVSANIVDMSEDGKTIVVGDYNSILIVDTSTKEESKIHVGHADRIRAVCISASGHIVVTGSLDKTVKLWSVQLNQQLAEIHLNAAVSCISLTQDIKSMFIGLVDGSLQSWQRLDYEGKYWQLRWATQPSQVLNLNGCDVRNAKGISVVSQSLLYQRRAIIGGESKSSFMQPDESANIIENSVITIEEFKEQESLSNTDNIRFEKLVPEDDEEIVLELEDQSDDDSVRCRCC